ncbi:hypothetical protein CFB82_35315 [Burkholderia sp. HI2714]|nr:hypothetical protein CFB82_35315 [Burkholderia sp. HI2714]
MNAPGRPGAAAAAAIAGSLAISFARDAHQPFPVLAGFDTWQLAFVLIGLSACDGVPASRSWRRHGASTAAPKETPLDEGCMSRIAMPPAAGKSVGGNHRPAPGPSRRSVALTPPALRPRARLPLRPTPFAPAPA